MNLLIVDDEIYAIEGIRLLLDWKKNGIDNVFDAASIAEAKDIFSREKIDMLLCDIELVEENGLDLLVWMNEQGYRTKTVFLTCHEVFGYAQKALQQGAVNYILKPARPEQMIQVINQVKELLEKEEEDPVVGLIKSYIPEKTEKSDFLKHLDSFLLENIEGDLSRNRIASEMYLNADYMGRLLKKETGLSLSEYIGKKKVTVASILLRTTTMPIIDVAQKVGIQELSYFFRLLKRRRDLLQKNSVKHIPVKVIIAMQRKEEKKKLRSKITTRTLLITLSLFVMLIMLACILLYGSYHMNVLSRQILDSAKTSLSVAQNMLDISLEKNAQMINILLSDNGYIYYPEEIKKEKEIVYKYTQLYNHCAKYTAQLELCDGVFVYDSYFDRWAVSGSSDSIFLQNGIRELVNAYKDKLDAPWIMAEVENKECLIHIQKNSDIIIGFWVSTDSLKKITDMELTAYGENAHLLVESYKKTDEENKDFSDKEYLEVFAVSRLHAFQLHALIPKDDIYKNVSVLKWMLVLISFIFLLLIAAQYVTTNHYVLKPLQLLKEAMIRIKNGDLSSRLNPSSVNPDFGEVYEALNNMSDELTKLKIDVYEERIKKQKFELEFLRMQIKPHFFLNCLNIIYSLVNAGRYSLIQTMVVRLSDYFRYIFRTTDSFVNVEKELEHVENYLQIQAVRYPDRFTYKIRRDTDTKNIIIPPMMIQTFVENSIKYGFSNPIRDQLKIGIRVLEEEEIYSITIRDNGKGFPPEVLKKLQEKSSLEDENGNHIGIQNTLKRLELLYQNRAIVEFENEEGAQVHIYLPKHQVEKLL